MSDFKSWEAGQAQQPAVWPGQVMEQPMLEQATKEPTVEENANMIRQAGEWLAKKAVEASGLARRVEELESLTKRLQEDLHREQSELDAERKAHEDTQRRLSNVEAELARKESTVHDLVLERDIAIGERNSAQQERDAARRDGEDWAGTAAMWERRYHEQDQANSVLQERCTRLQDRINSFKSAYAALSEAA